MGIKAGTGIKPSPKMVLAPSYSAPARPMGLNADPPGASVPLWLFP